MDEEPPHPINLDAVEVVLTVSLMMNAVPVDEVHVMRKPSSMAQTPRASRELALSPWTAG